MILDLSFIILIREIKFNTNVHVPDYCLVNKSMLFNGSINIEIERWGDTVFSLICKIIEW